MDQPLTVKPDGRYLQATTPGGGLARRHRMVVQCGGALVVVASRIGKSAFEPDAGGALFRSHGADTFNT